MTTHFQLSDFKPKTKTIVSIGNFDGLHKGHFKIIENLIATAQDNDFESVILTFASHPRKIVQPQSSIKILTTVAEKISILSKTGLDYLIIIPFDTSFSELSAHDFVKNILVRQMNIHTLIIGHDHRFGNNRSAGITEMRAFSKEFNFKINQISVEETENVAISSTLIRQAIGNGEILKANILLGYPYILSGKVVQGKQLGRTIGFPTANIAIDETDKLTPKIGVYFVQSIIDNETVFGLMNIGYRPTIDGRNITFEVFFIDFSADLYEKVIFVSIIDFVREEQKFDSIADLQLQLQKDKQFAISYRNKIQNTYNFHTFEAIKNL